MRVNQLAQSSIFEDVQSLRKKVDEAQLRDVSEDIRLLRRDVNFVLESLGSPAVFVEAYRSFVQECNQEMVRYRARLETLEGIIRMDNAEDAANENEKASKHSSRRATAKERRRPEKEVRYDSDSLSSDSSARTEKSTSDSSDSEDDAKRHRGRSRGSKSRTTSASQCVIRTREKGRRHLGLKELKPTNPLYRKLLSYQYYRLDDSSSGRTSRSTSKVKDCIKRMSLVLPRKFDGEDAIMVLDFIACFVQESDILGMNEAQAYLALPYLSGMAENQFNSVRGSSRASEGGVTCWPEAVQYLLRSYATSNAIQNAILALRDTKQKPGETETAYSTSLNKAFHRCDSMYSAQERCTMFVDGLDPAIRALVARHREEKRRITYLELVQYAQAEGDTLRARSKPKPRSKAFCAEGSTPSSSIFHGNPAEPGMDNVHFVGSNPESYGSSELPTTSDNTSGGDPALYAGGPRIRATPIPYASNGSRVSRPGWVGHAPQHHDDGNRNPGKSTSTICHFCYRAGHISPACMLPAREMSQIIVQYDLLSPLEKSRVPSASYEAAKAYLGTPVTGRNESIQDAPTAVQPAPAIAPVPAQGGQPGPQDGSTTPTPAASVQKN